MGLGRVYQGPRGAERNHDRQTPHDFQRRLRDGQILFTYLHLAPAPELTRGLRATGAIAVAYETVQRPDGSLPLLTLIPTHG